MKLNLNLLFFLIAAFAIINIETHPPISSTVNSHLKEASGQSLSQHKLLQKSQYYQHTQQTQPTQQSGPKTNPCDKSVGKAIMASLVLCQNPDLAQSVKCINKYIVSNIKQFWNVYVVEKSKPDGSSIESQSNCSIQKHEYGNDKRSYYIWPMKDYTNWDLYNQLYGKYLNAVYKKQCTLDQINNIKKIAQKGLFYKVISQRAKFISKLIKQSIKEKWSVLIMSRQGNRYNSYGVWYVFNKCYFKFSDNQYTYVLFKATPDWN